VRAPINRAVSVAATLWMIAGAPALASNLNFLKDAPATYFNKADQALFKNTMATTLNEATDGETRAWSNAETKSSGEVKVLRTLPGENRCRELQVTNRAAGRSHTERSVFCYEAKSDRWVMHPGSR